jgi:hypothetical protein
MWNLKKEALVAALIVLILSLIGVGIFAYNSFVKKETSSSFSSGPKNSLINPVSNLTDEEAELAFNETFVYYLLYKIKADQLKSSILAGGDPIINFYIDEDKYYSIVKKGSIMVFKGLSTDPDVNIKTTKSEGVKMLRDSEYIPQSFLEEKSIIELVASKPRLLAKGYLKLSEELMN